MSAHSLRAGAAAALLAAAAAGPARSQDAVDGPDGQRVEVTGEAIRSYAPKNSSTGAKSEAPIADTPVAVQTVEGSVLRDRAITTSLDALRGVSGVQAQPGSFYDQFQIRGFGSGYGVSYRNGLQLEGVADAVNPAFVERIEVVKGPASVLYGRVEPGGFVNIVTKRPQAQAALEVEQQFGRWGRHATSVDATGPLGDDGRLSGRLIGSFERADDFYDFQHYDRKAAYGTLGWKPSKAFEGNVAIELYDYRSGGRGPNTAVPVAGDRPDSSVPRSRSGSDPSIWDHFTDTVKRKLLAFDWAWHLSDQWTLQQRLHAVRVDEVQTGIGDWGGEWGFIDNPLWRTNYHTNLELAGRFATGGVGHELLIGTDFYRYKDFWRGFVGLSGISPVVTFYDPGYTDLTPRLQPLVDASKDNVLWRSFEADLGAYVQDRMSFGERWTLLAGLRWDRAWQRYTATYGSAGSDCYPQCTGEPLNNWPSDKAWSPRAALLYKADRETSLYASFSRSFGTNNSSYLPPGEKQAPEVGVQYELGAKRSLMDSRLLATATLFQLTKRNVLAQDPNDRLRQIAIGQVRSRGLELDLAGQVTRTLSVLAAYSWNPVVITRDTNEPSNEGHRRAGAPRQAASLWLKLDAGSGWFGGAGVQADGQRQGNDANSWQMPGYAIADAMLGWRTRLAGHGLELQGNVKNLFDRRYFDQIGYGTASWGTPRAWNVAARLDW